MSDLSDSLLRGGMILPTGDLAKDVAIWQTSVSSKFYVVQRNQINVCVDYVFCDCLFPKIDGSQSSYFMCHFRRNQIFKGRSSLRLTSMLSPKFR
jgi:hypothetical protein